MAKKLNNVYLDENRELETHTILVEGDGKKQKPKKQSKGSKVWGAFRPLVTFVVAAFLVGVGVYYTFNYIRGTYFDPVDVNDSRTIEVEIPKKASLTTISEILEEKELIRNKQVFKLYVDFSDMTSKLKPGTYQLSKDMEFDDIIYALQKGADDDPTTQVTLIEGTTVEDYAKVLLDEGVLENTEAVDEFLKLCRTGDGLKVEHVDIQEVIARDNVAAQKRKYVLEGYLFPETYEFYKDSTPQAILNRLLNEFTNKMAPSFYERMAELDMSLDQVVTIASIIEKEAKTDQFKQVSAVLHNRLNQDMKLQVDSSIAYDLGVKRIVLTDAELDTESPYNTYKVDGLPIGPIDNPGLDAIYAALYPDEEYMDEGYLYFTLTDPEKGKLVFSKSSEEQEELKAEYRPSWREADRKSSAANE